MQLVATWQHTGEPAALLHIFWTTRHVNPSCPDGPTDTPSDCTIQITALGRNMPYGLEMMVPDILHRMLRENLNFTRQVMFLG